MSGTEIEQAKTEQRLETEHGETEQRLETERRLDVAATLLSRGVRRVLGGDVPATTIAVEQENAALPVLGTEAVMAAPLNQENARR